MADQTFDPIRFKQDQRRAWDANAAGWNRFWPMFEHAAQPVSDRLVELAEIKPGHRVLDVATGTGEPALTAARKAGPTGRVIATDQSTAMLALARDRAAKQGLRNVEFRETDAELLAIPDREFDAALSRWGLMFLPDLTGALRKIHALLKPGGRLAAAVWDSPAKVPMICLAGEIVRRLGELPPPIPGTLDPTSLSDPAILNRALAEAGFTAIRREPLVVTVEFERAELLVRFREEVSLAFRTMLASKPPELADRLRGAITDAARAYAGADGVVRLANEAMLWSAHR